MAQLSSTRSKLLDRDIFNGVDMFDKIGLLAVSFLMLIIMPLCANSADSVVIDGGDLRISGLGSLVFPDGSVQNSASPQGPTGPTGPQGPQGPQGPTGPAGPDYSALNYYALGDSITHGVGSTSGSFSYADILNAKFNFNSFTKLAVSGATAMLTLGYSDLLTQVNSIGANADLITIMTGTVDYYLVNPLGDADAVLQIPYASLDNALSFAEAFRYCLETIKRDHEQARIYVILPIQENWGGPIPLDQYRAAEIKIANYLSIPVIFANTESGIWKGGTFIPDGRHPNDTGYTVLGNYIARKLTGL
jgi:lysophospholipase L1-like esterase